MERLAAAEMQRFAETSREVEADSAAQWLAVGGGIAAFVAEGSPVNQAIGLGMSGPVDPADVARLTRFYLDRGVRPLLCLCPLAHPSLLAALSADGWAVDGFEHVFVRTLGQHAQEPTREEPARYSHVEIREAVTDEDRELWRVVAATAFSWPLEPLSEQLALGAIIVRRPGTRLLLAFVDGKAAGTGELYIDDGVAWLSADATLPQFRGRGVQAALQARRLALGEAAGCELAVTEALPGSASQRNIERAGFRVAYTRVDLVRTDSR